MQGEWLVTSTNLADGGGEMRPPFIQGIRLSPMMTVSDGRLSLFGACNDLDGEFNIDADRIRSDAFFQTIQGCFDEAAEAWETALFEFASSEPIVLMLAPDVMEWRSGNRTVRFDRQR